MGAGRIHPIRRLARRKRERKPAALGKKRASPAHGSRVSPAGSGEHAPTPGPAPRHGRPAGLLTVRAGSGPSLLALAKSSRLLARVRRAHALLPAPRALYCAAPLEEEIDLSLPELFATRPFNRPRQGHQCPPPPPGCPTAAA